MWRAVVALASMAACAFTDSATAESWRLPDGIDNARPRYYDYRAPRRYYYDDAPVAVRVPPPSFVYVQPVQPAPPYAPTGTYLPPPGYPSPAYGYDDVPVTFAMTLNWRDSDGDAAAVGAAYKKAAADVLARARTHLVKGSA